VGFRVIIVSVFLLYGINLLAQIPVGIKSKSSLTGLSMDQWTGEDGLISNNLTSVFQSSDKFIWVTNFNGLLRFDGVKFKFFDKEAIPSLSTSSFYGTFEDSKGNIWFASQSSGIIKLRDNKFFHVLPVDQNSLSVRCIAEDAHGDLWVGTNNEGIYIYKDSLLQKFENDEFAMQSIMDIMVDKKGNVWVATNGNGLVKYTSGNIKKYSVADGLPHHIINKLTEGADGTIYGGTVNGIFFIDKNDVVGILDRIQNHEINDLLIDGYDNIWFASEQGLYRYALGNQKLDSLTEATGLPGSQVSSLHFDHENSLWVATKKAGLLRFRDGFFENHSTKEGLSSNNVNIIVSHENRLYVGCDDGAINIISGGSISQLKRSSLQRKLGIRDILFRDNDDIYVGSYEGLSRIRNGVELTFDFAKYGGANDVRRILETKSGDLWLATRSGGAIKYRSDNDVTIYNSKNGLKVDYILAIEEGNNGEIYIGTHSGGLSIIKPDGEISNYPIEGGKSGVLIFNIEVQPDNAFLAATNAGLYKFDNQKFKRINIDEKIKIETFFDVVTDREYAWISTNTGVIRLRLEDMEKNFKGEIKAVEGRIFDRYDGMASQECTGATRMTLDANGRLIIPTLGGVSILKTSEMRENTTIPNVFVTDLVVDGESKDISSNILTTIKPGAVRFEFFYTALSFIAPPKVRFKYQLSGVDRDWIDAGTDRSVVYTNLPPGNYTFSVIGANNDGVWNNNGSFIKFHVQPFYYQTRTFVIGIILFFGLILWGAITWRIRSVERVNKELLKLNEELDRFVYSASHDLRAPLSSVLGLVEIARLETTVEGKELCLTMIRDSVRKLDGFIKDIIDYSRNQRLEISAEKINIREVVEEAFSELRYLDKDNFIEKHINCPDDRHFMTDGKRLSVVMKNLISNAIRYHDLKKAQRFIKVDISYKPDKAVIEVSDNGIGIDSNHIENIFKMFYRADESSSGSGLGLYIVKESIEKLKGTIEVNSTPDIGTTFTVTIPSLRPIS